MRRAALRAFVRGVPDLIHGVLHGATKAGARPVVLDNVYMTVRSVPNRSTKRHPSVPTVGRGAPRSARPRHLVGPSARRRARGRGTCVGLLRSSNADRDRVSRELLPAGAGCLSTQLVGDPDQPHSYSYTPDVAEALVTLGARAEALGRVWHVVAVYSAVDDLMLIETFRGLSGGEG